MILLVEKNLLYRVTKVLSPPVSPLYLKQVWDYLKFGFDFTEDEWFLNGRWWVEIVLNPLRWDIFS